MDIVKLVDVCEFEKGTTGLAKAVPGEFPLVTTGAVRKTCNFYQFDTKAVCIPLVSSTGHGHASLKNVHYQEGKFSLGTILVALTSIDESRLDIHFLHLYLSQLKDQILVPLMSGAANVALSVTKIKNIEIPLPPLKKQQEIVKKFKSIANEEDEIKSELTHQQTLLTKLRQQILQEAIEGKLTTDWRAANPDAEPASELLKRITADKAQLIKEKKIKMKKPLLPISEEEKPFELPNGWVWCRLGQLVSSATNGVYKPASYYSDDGVPSLRMYNIQNGEISLNKLRRINLSQKELAQYLLEAGDLLLNRVNSKELVGKTAIIRDLLEPSVFESMNMRLRLVIPSMGEFVNKFLLLSYARNYFSNICKIASGQVSVNQGQVFNICIPVPSLAEQQIIVAEVEKLLTLCLQLEVQIIQSQTHAERIMQAVLKEAFSHNTDPQAAVNTLERSIAASW